MTFTPRKHSITPLLIRWHAVDRSLQSSASFYGYQVFTAVLGFVLVFRCQLAYSRFWDGRSAVERMSSNWCDAAIKSVVFDSKSKRSLQDIRSFRNRIVSLISMLHACALSSLSDYTSENDFEILEGGLHHEYTFESLNSELVEDRLYLAFTWVQYTLTHRIDDKFGMPPPISTRLFQEPDDTNCCICICCIMFILKYHLCNLTSSCVQ